MSGKSEDCGLSTALKAIGGKWKVDILCALLVAPRRFGRLRQLIPGISEKMLRQHLREMEADGLVNRKVFAETPAKVVYSLTEIGAAVEKNAAAFCEWGKMLEDRRSATPPATQPSVQIGGL